MTPNWDPICLPNVLELNDNTWLRSFVADLIFLNDTFLETWKQEELRDAHQNHLRPVLFPFWSLNMIIIWSEYKACIFALKVTTKSVLCGNLFFLHLSMGKMTTWYFLQYIYYVFQANKAVHKKFHLSWLYTLVWESSIPEGSPNYGTKAGIYNLPRTNAGQLFKKYIFI